MFARLFESPLAEYEVRFRRRSHGTRELPRRPEDALDEGWGSLGPGMTGCYVRLVPSLRHDRLDKKFRYLATSSVGERSSLARGQRHEWTGIFLKDAHGCAVSANTFTLMKTDALRITGNSGRIAVTGNSFCNSYIGESKIPASATR